MEAAKLELNHNNGWMDNHARVVGYRGDGQVIIINRSSCDHPDVGKGRRETDPPPLERDGRSSWGQCNMERKRNERRRRRRKQDLSAVLKSLDAANDLAQRLKARSEQMLDLLSTEISTLHTDITT